MDNQRKYVTAPRDLAAAHCRAASVIEDRCSELNDKRPDEAGSHGAMYISAALLRAFSIELALKSLYYAEARALKRGHCLQSLFEMQMASTQTAIETLANKGLCRPFRDVLAKVSNVFVDWRYVHEKVDTDAELGFDTEELKTIAHAVLQVLDERRRGE